MREVGGGNDSGHQETSGRPQYNLPLVALPAELPVRMEGELN